MKRALGLLVCMSLVFGARAFASDKPRYQPPVTRDDGPGVSIWFGRVVRNGQWCAFDEQTMRRNYEKNELASDESGWARYGANGLMSVTFVSGSEDALAEDQYFLDLKGTVTRMIRTGHYINDPLASVTFEPDAQGRLRLTASSKKVVERMKAADYDPYFVEWEHFSRLSQLPFAKLIGLKTAPRPGAC